ncbi:MAG: peptide-methionine (S)-S-oxide reductase MsrA [Bacteroidota bacterium]
MAGNDKLETAIVGGGCFWCTEAIFQRVKGVEQVEPGYAGGEVDNPSYKQVCGGNTGHAEVIRIQFDPSVIGYKEILGIFMATHDPTQLNRQGNDVGTQYRSTIMPLNDTQKQIAEAVIAELKEKGVFGDPIVTTIEPLDEEKDFYVAEQYHHNYYNDNPSQGYCSVIIDPKVRKFKQQFDSYLKDSAK